MNSFEAVWALIRASIKSNEQYRGWTRDKGDTHLTFQAFESSPNAITVTSPTLTAPRRITKTEIEKVYQHWADYCSGKLGRAEMGQISQNTSYIFGILHSVLKETRSKGAP